MKKILKILNGVLIGTSVLLAGSCATILLYSKFHINQDKNNYTLIEQNSDNDLYDSSKETYIPNISDMEDVLADSNEEYITADLNDENIQEALSMEQVYDMLCDKFSLTEDNLLYYGELNINGEPYYGFEVIDAGGGGWESLLVYNRNTNKEYFYDVLGNISEVEKDTFANINVYENITTYPDTQETENGSQEDIGVSYDNAEKEYCNGLKWGTQLKLVNKEYAPLDKSVWLLNTYYGTCDSLDGYKSDKNIDMTFYFNDNDELIKIDACIDNNEIDDVILYFVEYYNKIYKQNYTQAGDTRYRWFGEKTNVSMYSTSDGVLYITYEPAISE